jgi:hypothetical protein
LIDNQLKSSRRKAGFLVMERHQRIPLEDQIRAQLPNVLDEMRKAGLNKGAKIDHVKAVLPRYAKPDVLEKVFGKNLLRNNGHTVLTEQQILFLFVHRDFDKQLRDPQQRKKIEKVIRKFSEEYVR